MHFGVPKELGQRSRSEEKRVGLTPGGVRELVEAGASVVVESGAGASAGFLDEAYRKAGAQVLYSREEVYGRADVVVKIATPEGADLLLMQPGAAVFAFWHLAVTYEALKAPLEQSQVTAIGYEIVEEADGSLPVLRVSSEIAGVMSPQIAGRLLETESGGLGILLPGAPGIPPADVVIVGGGTLGYYAARAFLGLGCSCHVLDVSRKRLEVLDQLFGGRVTTALATRLNLEKYVAFADVLIGAVLRPGEVAPTVIRQEMVRSMRPGSVILDFSFDQGGCVETTRLQGPTGGTFVREGVLHFAVPNCPSLVARSASQAHTHTVLPYLLDAQKIGLEGAIKSRGELLRGCYAWHGRIVRRGIADEAADIGELLGG